MFWYFVLVMTKDKLDDVGCFAVLYLYILKLNVSLYEILYLCFMSIKNKIYIKSHYQNCKCLHKNKVI